MTTFTTELREHNMCARFYCVICGGDYQQNLVAVELVEKCESGDVHWGGICPSCLERRTFGALISLGFRRVKLEQLEQAVKEIETWVTPEQLNQAEQEIDKSICELFEGAEPAEVESVTDFEPY